MENAAGAGIVFCFQLGQSLMSITAISLPWWNEHFASRDSVTYGLFDDKFDLENGDERTKTAMVFGVLTMVLMWVLTFMFYKFLNTGACGSRVFLPLVSLTCVAFSFITWSVLLEVRDDYNNAVTTSSVNHFGGYYILMVMGCIQVFVTLGIFLSIPSYQLYLKEKEAEEEKKAEQEALEEQKMRQNGISE